MNMVCLSTDAIDEDLLLDGILDNMSEYLFSNLVMEKGVSSLG